MLAWLARFIEPPRRSHAREERSLPAFRRHFADSSALIAFCAALPRLPLGPLTNSAACHVSRSVSDSSLCRGDGYTVVKKWDSAGYRSDDGGRAFRRRRSWLA
jgi:hypothetical protein